MNAIITKAKALIAQIQLDDTGMMVARHWVNGGGGLLSRETMKCADELRRAIELEERPALDGLSSEAFVRKLRDDWEK